MRSAEISEVHLEVGIDAEPAAVWQALTENIGAWWPEEGYGGGEPGARDFHLEPHPGGRMYESWQGGGGLLWGTVISVQPGELLQVQGVTFPEWGGPSLWLGAWRLEAQGEGTVLRFTDSSIGSVSEKLDAEKSQGWAFLFGEALKAHVEGSPAPTWD